MMSRPTELILDHIEPFSIPVAEEQLGQNEFFQLSALWEGMEFLYERAKYCDDLVMHRIAPNVRMTIFGCGPETKDVNHKLLTSAFNWYAVTACNFVGTVAKVAGRHTTIPGGPKQYTASVIPEIQAYRNKVAAHFAWEEFDNRDSAAEKMASVLPQLSFQGDGFYIGGWTIQLRRNGNSSDSKSIRAWSLRKEHDKLRRRYRPGLATPNDETAGQLAAEECSPT